LVTIFGKARIFTGTRAFSFYYQPPSSSYLISDDRENSSIWTS
jgi:hypothetical protein